MAWDVNHAGFLGVGPGDETGQATFEAYMMLEAIVCWITEETLGKILLIGDAEGVLFGLTRFSAKAQIVNEIAKEIALHLAPFGQTLSGSHVWGEQNEVADALSRLEHGAVLPGCLVQAVRRTTPSRDRNSWSALGSSEPIDFPVMGDGSL